MSRVCCVPIQRRLTCIGNSDCTVCVPMHGLRLRYAALRFVTFFAAFSFSSRPPLEKTGSPGSSPCCPGLCILHLGMHKPPSPTSTSFSGCSTPHDRDRAHQVLDLFVCARLWSPEIEVPNPRMLPYYDCSISK